MPQIDKATFLPQIFGLFIFLVLFFICLIQIHGIVLASVFKVRSQFILGLKDLSATKTTSLSNSHEFLLLLNCTLFIKDWALDFNSKAH